jgi:hypothetical protein
MKNKPLIRETASLCLPQVALWLPAEKIADAVAPMQKGVNKTKKRFVRLERGL